MKNKVVVLVVLLVAVVGVITAVGWVGLQWYQSSVTFSGQNEQGAVDLNQAVETLPVEPIDREFSIVMPRIGLNAPVFANIDGTNEYSYLPRILKGVAHYQHKDLGKVVVDGAFPGDGTGNIFLFGHSQIPGGDMSDYQGVFNNLEELRAGDVITVYYQGQPHQYVVRSGEVVDVSRVDVMAHTETETLTLMSCWPLGLDWKRYIIRAEAAY